MSLSAKSRVPIVFATALAFACTMAAALVKADESGGDLKTCQNWHAPASAALIACTRLIDSGLLTPLGRSGALTMRGQAFQKLGETDWAKADFDEAISIRSNYQTALIDRAELGLKSGSFEDAIADFGRAIDLDPRSYLFLERGHAFEANGDLDHGIEDFGRAAALDPRHPFGFYDRGRDYLQKGNLVAAIADFDAAIKVDSTIKGIFLDRGVAHQRSLDPRNAEADFTRALVLDPVWTLALENRGITFASIGEFDKAIADYTAALRIEPQSARMLTLRGEARSGKGDLSGAIEDFDHALVVDPTYDDASRQKLVAFARSSDQRDPDRDLHECDQLLAFQPFNVDLLVSRATILLKKGRRDEALKTLDAVLKLKPQDQRALDQRAQILGHSP